MKNIRLWLTALAFALVASIIAVPAAPAQADNAGGGRVCIPVYDERGVIINWVCVPILVRRDRPEPDPCLCPDWFIDISRELVLPVDDQIRFVTDTVEGLELLAVSARTEDRGRAEELRRAALGELVSAVEVLRGQPVRLGDVGVVNVERNESGPSPEPWLESVGAGLTEGLTLTQTGAFDEAARAFDNVVAQLTG